MKQKALTPGHISFCLAFCCVFVEKSKKMEYDLMKLYYWGKKMNGC